MNAASRLTFLTKGLYGRKIFIQIFFAFIFFQNSSQGMEEEQKFWEERHVITPSMVQTSNPDFDPTNPFSVLHPSMLPHPGPYHLYLYDAEGCPFTLVRDTAASDTKTIRLYGTSAEGITGYTTIAEPTFSDPKEVLVKPRPSDSKFKGRTYPSKTLPSTTYPKGVRTYYIQIKGKWIRFDRGHGVPLADTRQHPKGTTSTLDPENYAPQNIKFNSPIRRDLEDKMREKKKQYKEISVYHPSCIYDVFEKNNGKGKKYQMPIPEGFIILVYGKDNSVEESYYFPNFIDYEDFKTQSSHQYASVAKKFAIDGLSQWFVIPEIMSGLSEDQLSKLDLATDLGIKIRSMKPTLFKGMSEELMPGRARVALLMTLLTWNLQTAATLEFLGFQNQLLLAHFHLSREKLSTLDERSPDEQEKSVQTFLADDGVSEAAKDAVRFIARLGDFRNLQVTLRDIIDRLTEMYRNSPHLWEMPEFCSTGFVIESNHEEHVLVPTKVPPESIEKLRVLVGGTSPYCPPKARNILAIIDHRTQERPTSILEKLHILRLYHDYEELVDKGRQIAWERAIYDHIMERGVSLRDLRMVTDFYSYRSLKSEKHFWLNQFFGGLSQSPSFEKFAEIAEWCATGRAAFLEDMEDQSDPNRANNMLALQIYKALVPSHAYLLGVAPLKVIEHLETELGLFKRDFFGIRKQRFIDPFFLEPLTKERSLLRQISQLFWNFLKVQNIIPLSVEHAKPASPFIKASVDFMHEARFYHKLGVHDLSLKAAENCTFLARSSREFRKAANVWTLLGNRENSEKAAQSALGVAKKYDDFIDVIRAFHSLGLEEKVQQAKEKCFEVMKPYEGIFAAAAFHHAGFEVFSLEAARRFLDEQKGDSNSLIGAMRYFNGEGMRKAAKEAAMHAKEITQEKESLEVVTEYLKRLELDE